MKVLLLAAESDHCQKLSIYTSGLCQSLSNLAEDKKDVEQMVFSERINKNKDLVYNKNLLSDYYEASKVINDQYDICILQYAANAYGGFVGNYILSLVAQLKVPLVTAFHDLNNEPGETEKSIVQVLANKSQCVFTFSQLGLEVLEHYYKVGHEKILKTNYAVNVFNTISKSERNAYLNASCDKIILACGPMDHTSGFETIINALPAVTKIYTDLNLVLINTGSVGSLAKEYERSLYRLASQRGVNGIVKIIDYTSLKISLDVIMNAADVHVSSVVDDKKLDDIYLSMAINSGAAVVSTPTWFAKELLDEQKGTFFDFKSASALSSELLIMLRGAREMQMYRDNASLYGVQNSWSVIAKRINELLESFSTSTATEVIDGAVNTTYLPSLNLKHLLSLIHANGCLKQSSFGVPDLQAGYCLESSANALRVLIRAYKINGSEIYRTAIMHNMAFIKLMQGTNGKWLAGYGVAGTDATMCSENVLGQVIWALGELNTLYGDHGLRGIAYDMVRQIIKDYAFTDVKAMSYAVLGLIEFLKLDYHDDEILKLVKNWSDRIKSLFPDDAYQTWQWHSNEIDESMALLPLALLRIHQLFNDTDALSKGKRAMRFLERHVLNDNRFAPKVIGLKKGEEKVKLVLPRIATETSLFTQAYNVLYDITKEKRYANAAAIVHNWYLSDNALGKSLYDIESGGCYHSISGRSVNPLMTAKSTSAFWLSQFALIDIYFKQIIEKYKA